MAFEEYSEKDVKPRRSRKKTRGVKVAQELPKPDIKEKFAEEHQRNTYEIKPMTENQATYMKLLRTKDFVVASGSSGTGKSFLACIHAANKYLKNEVSRIILVRPYEHVSRSIGLRPGSANDKLRPLLMSMLQTIELVVGKPHMEYMIAKGILVMEALEDIRGRSYSDAILLVDESQNVDVSAMKALLTRSGENCQIVMCGDSLQQDTKGIPGIAWVLGLVEKAKQQKPDILNDENMSTLFNSIGHVEFTMDDIVRSGMCSLFVKLFDWEAVNAPNN